MVEILNGEIPFDRIQVGSQLADRVDFGVVFVANFADNFFKQIFQRDDTGGASIFVHHYGHVQMHRLKLPQHNIETGTVGDKMHRTQQRLQVYGPVPLHMLQQVLDVKYAEGIVEILPENGNAGIVGLIDNGQDIPYRVCNVDRRDLSPRDHHLVNPGLADFENIIQHFPLLFGHTVGAGSGDHGSYFLFRRPDGKRAGRSRHPDNPDDPVGDPGSHAGKRGKEPDGKSNGQNQLASRLLRVRRRNDFRRQLAENEDDQRQDDGSGDTGEIDMLPGDIGGDNECEQACRGNIGYRIAQKNYAQEPVGLPDNPPDRLRLPVSGFRLILQALTVQAHESYFGACKKHRKTHEENKKDKINQQG